jgi:hypothetical protein
MKPPFEHGDRVTLGVRTENTSSAGIVVLASANNRAIMVVFDGMLAGWVGMVGLNWWGDHYEDFHNIRFTVEHRGGK